VQHHIATTEVAPEMSVLLFKILGNNWKTILEDFVRRFQRLTEN